jgi:hypothetical protein
MRERQSKDYLIFNLSAHYLNLSVTARRQTFQHLGTDATSAKRERAIRAQLPLPVRRQGRKKSPAMIVITHSGMSTSDFFTSLDVHRHRVKDHHLSQPWRIRGE